MGASKSELFSENENRMAELMKAMAHPARIAIIRYLLQQPGCICGDLVHELPLAQPTISQHLKELKRAQIIQGNIDGNSICYCLNPQTINEILSYFNQINGQLNSNTCC